MEEIIIRDKSFSLSIGPDEIARRVNDMAKDISTDLKERELVFIIILNGAFMFASDLLKQITIPCLISFVKLASYSETTSSGTIKKLIGLNEELKDKTVVIIEDIVDTGNTLDAIIKQIRSFDAAEIKVASLLHKPEVYTHNYTLDYVGFRVPNKFLVGYGLDYDGLGRNLTGIYTELLA